MSEEIKMADLNNTLSQISNEESAQVLADAIQSIMDIPEESLNDTNVNAIVQLVSSSFTPDIRKKSVADILKNFDDSNLTRSGVRNTLENAKAELIKAIDELDPSVNKRKILLGVFQPLFDIMDETLEKYHNYDIILPIMLDEGATMPTYAHDTDAAADLYARETVVIPAHSLSNKVSTGVHLQLPENWAARIIPRSSIGAKTPLRLSNSQGLIDPAYTGDIIVLFDNVSDSDYTINSGDRISQLWVEPVHRFKATQINTLQETERNSDGFGSTGK